MEEVKRWKNKALVSTPSPEPVEPKPKSSTNAKKSGESIDAAVEAPRLEAPRLEARSTGESSRLRGASFLPPLLATAYLLANELLKLSYPAMACLKVLPIATLCLLVATIPRHPSDPPQSYAKFVALGLGLSGCGDMLLELEPMVAGDLLFLLGLGAFLAAHWLYIQAFASHLAACRQQAALPADPLSLPLAAACGAYAASFFQLLRSSGDMAPALQPPVAFYAFSIGTMLWFALRVFRAPSAPGGSNSSSKSGGVRSGVALVGALLFVVSDSVLGYNKFVAPLAHQKVAVMVTYYGAQICLAFSAAGGR